MADNKSKPITIDELAKNINDYFWYRRQVSEGAKGPIVYEFTRRQVILAAEGLPQKTVWLLIRRTIGDEPEYSYFISNAASSTRLKTLVWLSGMRWAIEQCFEETKGELGMDHYEVRKFRGWHHHMLTCMLAHFFLWHLKIRMGKKSAVYYAASLLPSTFVPVYKDFYLAISNIFYEFIIFDELVKSFSRPRMVISPKGTLSVDFNSVLIP